MNLIYGNERERAKLLEESEWIIEIHFEEIKAMFDSVIRHDQRTVGSKSENMFGYVLFGGFGGSDRTFTGQD
jgi:hypothetical protein